MSRLCVCGHSKGYHNGKYLKIYRNKLRYFRCRICECEEFNPKNHQTPEDKTLADAEAVRHNSMQDGSSSVPRSEALNQRTKTSGDFCLSDKIKVGKFTNVEIEHILFDTDVKEFVRRLKEAFDDLKIYEKNGNIRRLIFSRIDKLAGEKLI